MKLFTESEACKSRQFCRSCRTDSEWRKTILASGKIPESDFACPHGITATTLPIQGIGDLVERVARPIAKLFRIPCHDATGALKPKSPCNKKRRLLNKLVPIKIKD